MHTHPIIFKAEVIWQLRKTLEQNEFIELMTPVVRRYPGDGDRPRLPLSNVGWLRESSAFALRCNLQIAPRIYEIGPSFRPDDVDATHLPEFTMLDLYAQDSSLNEMLSLSQSLVATAYNGKTEIFSFANHLKNELNIDLFNDPNSSNELIHKLWDIYGNNNTSPLWHIDKYITEKIEPLSNGKCLIVTDFPLITEMRAKKRVDTAGIVERFEILIDGIEIVHGYTDEDDVDRFERQARKASSFGPEDEIMCRLLRSGKTPLSSSGFAIGIERLCQVASGRKDVIDFSASREFSFF